MRTDSHPPAFVLGEIDLLRALALANIRSAVAAAPGEPARYSRYASFLLPRIDPRRAPAAAVESLLHFAHHEPEAPVLFYDADWDLLLVSRFRDQLRPGLRFVIPEPELVEDLVDKARFQALAERAGLPVPPAVQLLGGRGRPYEEPPLRFPVVVKPLTRDQRTWRPITTSKAIEIGDGRSLRRLLPRLAEAEIDVLIQEAIPGPETSVESYHVYVDASGNVAGEFTGRKLRTWPRKFGYSTALEITSNDQVMELGREIVARLGLRGVAKLDFKRGRDGDLLLLEVNPRFNLWHHPAAHAGVNIPALVYADLTNATRPAARSARPGVRWCSPAHDLRAARASGLGTLAWLRWLLACEAVSGFSAADPLPLPRAAGSRTLSMLRDRVQGAGRKKAAVGSSGGE